MVKELEEGNTMVKVIAFAGSVRRESFNRRLVRIAASGARLAGADVEVLELNDYPMPFMDEDYETDNGIPEHAVRFREKLLNCRGLLISAPEYNSSITPLLKNALDWASRINSPREKPLSVYRNTTAVLMSASPGYLGGMRGLVPLRMLLGELGVTVIPEYKCISAAHEAFAEDGSLKNPGLQREVINLGMTLVESLGRL